ncbi:MAG: tetratricopeptide repeat protein [Prevotella sp.]|nr:tetratricopeptide repeat protein [Prevotella sp.]
MKRILLIYIMCITALGAMAQNDRYFIRSGNKYFHQQNYAKAEVEYRKALAKNGSNPQALYNLGCVLLAQQRDSAAITQFEKAAKMETTKMRKAKVYHNIGVICQKHLMYGDAIKAYEESLRNNPHDNETRYNLVLCKRNNKAQNQNQNQQNKDNKDKNKDKKKDKQDKDQKKNEQQKQQQQKKKMSKDNAEQLLNAAMQNEKATQQRLKKAMQQPNSRRLQKNW